MTQLSESSSEQADVEAMIEQRVAGRSGKTYQQVIRDDGDEIPEFMRPAWIDLGDEDIPIERYTSREFLQLEVEHVWRKVWQMVCREEEIPEPGDHIVYDIVDDSFIITRTRDGSIKALQNACMHRGRRLRTVDGRVPELRCAFHGWTWELDGEIKRLPCSDWDFKHVDKQRYALPEAKVATWGGFVFINMDPNCGPLEEQLDPVPDHFKHVGYESRYKSAHVAQVVSCNWKVALEAFMEAYHLPATHPQTAPNVQDYMSQVDLFGKNVNRVLSARGVSSSTLGELEEEDIYESYIEGRTFYEERLGTSSRDLSREALGGLPEGMTARAAHRRDDSHGARSSAGHRCHRRPRLSIVGLHPVLRVPELLPVGFGDHEHLLPVPALRRRSRFLHPGNLLPDAGARGATPPQAGQDPLARAGRRLAGSSGTGEPGRDREPGPHQHAADPARYEDPAAHQTRHHSVLLPGESDPALPCPAHGIHRRPHLTTETHTGRPRVAHASVGRSGRRGVTSAEVDEQSDPLPRVPSQSQNREYQS